MNILLFIGERCFRMFRIIFFSITNDCRNPDVVSSGGTRKRGECWRRGTEQEHHSTREYCSRRGTSCMGGWWRTLRIGCDRYVFRSSITPRSRFPKELDQAWSTVEKIQLRRSLFARKLWAQKLQIDTDPFESIPFWIDGLHSKKFLRRWECWAIKNPPQGSPWTPLSQWAPLWQRRRGTLAKHCEIVKEHPQKADGHHF